MSTLLSLQQIRALPKIDLHRHLDCSMRWSTMLEIATTLKLDFPKKPAQQKDFFLVTEPMVDLKAVLNKFLVAQKLLASEEILERLAFEACEDAYNDGVRIIEMRYAPTFISQGHPTLSFDKIHQAFLKGLKKAEAKMNIATGLIGILQRIQPLEQNQKVMQFILENKSTFIGVDLADSENEAEPALFVELFEKAKAAGLKITIHTGETPSKDAERWMNDAINKLHADRIGHGVQSILYPSITEQLIAKNITLEVCPYSNSLTNAFKSLKDHPLKKLKNKGVPVTINSDDPGVFISTLSDDYLIAQNDLGFTLQDFEACNQTAFNASFISRDKKSKAWHG